MVPHKSNFVLVGGLITVVAMMQVISLLLLHTATPYSGDELMMPQETAMSQYPSCPSVGSMHGQVAAANGEHAFGVCPAEVPMNSSDGDMPPHCKAFLNLQRQKSWH